jgi:prepilin-type N-terminal cleavage/methylation domain-containing protein
MLTRRRAAPRRGFTLIELLVSMIVAGVVLTLLTLTGLRQQRLLGDLLEDASLAGQLREASALLPIELRALGSAAGDVREARDTALEIRGTIASGVVCDTLRGSLVLAAAAADADTYTSYATAIQAGDTAWLYAPADGGDVWLPRAVVSVGSIAGAQCGLRGPSLSADIAARPRTVIALDSAVGFIAIGRPLRVTRPLRLSLYRSADGSWNLGERDWNASTQRFNTIQPVAGPFLAARDAGLALAYLDSNGLALPTPVTDPRAVAAIAFTLRGQTRVAVRALGAATRAGNRVDSARAVVLLRNRR